jgi:hypothetical protein
MKSAAIALDEHDKRGKNREEFVGEAQPKVDVIFLPTGGNIIRVLTTSNRKPPLRMSRKGLSDLIPEALADGTAPPG